MTKTSFDMITDAYRLLNVVELTSIITGDLYKLERPKNSTVEDIVINALPISAEQFQKGIFNVNIHVPNINATIGGQPDNTMPDMERMQGIANIVLKIIGDVVQDGYRIFADNGGYPIKDVQDRSWYLNIRFNYLHFQFNYTNI